MTNEQHILKLHATIQLAARDFLYRCAAEQLVLVITQGLRTNEEQAKLYAQGRTEPGAIVTFAPPGYSWHNFGLAFDVAFKGATWAEMNTRAWLPLWNRIGVIGEFVGLEWGGRWAKPVDLPHFQYRGGLTLAQARSGERPNAGPFLDEEEFPLKENDK